MDKPNKIDHSAASLNKTKKILDLKYPLQRYGAGDLVAMDDGRHGEVVFREPNRTDILWGGDPKATTYKWAENVRMWPQFKGHKGEKNK